MKKLSIITAIISVFTIALTSCGSTTPVAPVEESVKLKAKLQPAFYSTTVGDFVASPASTIVFRYVDALSSVGDAITLDGKQYIILDMEQPINQCPFEGDECPNVQTYILEHDKMVEQL